MRTMLAGLRGRVALGWVVCGLVAMGAARVAGAGMAGAEGWLAGDLRTHDPSTVIFCDGRYYVFSTGGGIPILSSADGWTWERAGKVFDTVPDSVHAVVPLNDGKLVWAPDIIKVGNEYYLYYSISSWGSNVSAVGLMKSPTLNQKDPAYKWTDGGLVVNSVKGENLNAIDPGVMLAPDGTMWLTYGSYIGNVQLIQLNPKTGLRIRKDSPAPIVSSASEASDLIYHDGYYYLFVNRGSCCQKEKSSYNIRMGRSKKVTGPYLDAWGADMAKGGGNLFLASEGKQIGPGHFGLLMEDGVEKFSLHHEADLGAEGNRGGLDIRPLLWGLDGWPAAGAYPKDGEYQVRSKRTGLVLEMAAATAAFDTSAGASAATAPAAGAAEFVKQARYVTIAGQRWQLARAGKYFKFVDVGGKRALAASGAGLSVADAGAGTVTGDDRLWEIDQVSDGSFRIQTKTDKLALTALVGVTGLELKKWSGDDAQRWVIDVP